jgi:myo-inositol-1(or 4)-monophosphatase
VPEPVDWLSLCRRVVDAQREIFAAHSGVAARTTYEGIGEGGDRALVIDRRCEDAVIAELEEVAAAAGLTVISEEAGRLELGGGGPPVVVVDPIDGSLNARRTIPTHCVSIAVGTGHTLADVEFGYIYDFGSSEEFAAEAGKGATLNGESLAPPTHDGLEVVGIESAKPEWVLPVLEHLSESTYRFRAPGSLAISLCYVAAGRFDGMLSARHARSVDVAAGQLIVREAGALVSFDGQELSEAGVDLDDRYFVAAALGTGSLRTLRAAQERVEQAA